MSLLVFVFMFSHSAMLARVACVEQGARLSYLLADASVVPVPVYSQYCSQSRTQRFAREYKIDLFYTAQHSRSFGYISHQSESKICRKTSNKTISTTGIVVDGAVHKVDRIKAFLLHQHKNHHAVLCRYNPARNSCVVYAPG